MWPLKTTTQCLGPVVRGNSKTGLARPPGSVRTSTFLPSSTLDASHPCSCSKLLGKSTMAFWKKSLGEAHLPESFSSAMASRMARHFSSGMPRTHNAMETACATHCLVLERCRKLGGIGCMPGDTTSALDGDGGGDGGREGIGKINLGGGLTSTPPVGLMSTTPFSVRTCMSTGKTLVGKSSRRVCLQQTLARGAPGDMSLISKFESWWKMTVQVSSVGPRNSFFGETRSYT